MDDKEQDEEKELTIHEVVDRLLTEDLPHLNKTRTLIFTLSADARSVIEHDLKSSEGTKSSLGAIIRSRTSISVLFLNKLQYLYMYLMKFEAVNEQNTIEYNSFVIYGLDSLIEQMVANERSENAQERINVEQLRIANLIFNTLFRIKRKLA